MERNLKEFMSILADVPDTQMDKVVIDALARQSKRVTSFEEDLEFLRNVRDCCVRYALSSDFVIVALSAVLDRHPETEEAAERRRATIEDGSFSLQGA